jgi:prepilin signal peptidase PulO-like enzyme (type II secretory pathway)
LPAGVRKAEKRYPSVYPSLDPSLFAFPPGLLPGAWPALLTAVYCVALALVGCIDLEERRVPNMIVFPVTGLALLACLWLPQPGQALWLAGGGAAVGLSMFLALRRAGEHFFGPGALGMGDVKLAMLLGAMVGLQWVAVVLLLGILLAGAAGLCLLLTDHAQRHDHLSYGFYLAAAGLLVLLLIPLS